MTMLVVEAVWNGIVEVIVAMSSSSNGVQDIVIDIIVMKPKITSRALNSMEPGGSNHFYNVTTL